jgi:hypothetical protein
VTGGVRDSNIIGGQGHTVSITTQQVVNDALRPGEGFALGFWSMVSLLALVGALLLVPDLVLWLELVACIVLPLVALRAVFDLAIIGRDIEAAVVHLVFTLLISWIVLRNYYGGAGLASHYGGLNLVPANMPWFLSKSDEVFLNGILPSRSEFLNVLAGILTIAFATWGMAFLIVAHAKLGLSFMNQNRDFTHAVKAGLWTVLWAFIGTVFASGAILAAMQAVLPQFLLATSNRRSPSLPSSGFPRNSAEAWNKSGALITRVPPSPPVPPVPSAPVDR